MIRWLVTSVSVLCIVIQFFGTTRAIPILAKEGKFVLIGSTLALLSTCISALDKYYVALSKRQSIMRIGQFMIR